jgi:hypothetical protein
MDILLDRRETIRSKRTEATTIYIILERYADVYLPKKSQDIIQTAREIHSELETWF